VYVRRRPTLPQPHGCSTIGAERLNFRVRDGTGCFPFAMAAVTLAECISTRPLPPAVGGGGVGGARPSHYSCVWVVCVGCGRECLCRVLLFWLRVCGTSPRPISTGRLGIAAVHLRPINPVFCWGPYPTRGGKPHLETCFPLRCIQRLSLPNVANQPCPWRDNWHTRGSSIPVLSY
jgi:hypothetical protein